MSRRIHVFPAWEQNPYLNMLYIGARAEGWVVEGSKNFDGVLTALPNLIHGDIFHLHWTSPILNPDWDHDQAARSLERFEQTLLHMKAAGIWIIWTVHNALAHNTPHTDLEIELASMLARCADRIIQLNAHTRDAVADYYDIPQDKLVTLGHASYVGTYSEPPSQDSAREILGIPATAAVVGFVGQMRAYKGIPVLLGAVGVASHDVDNLVLVLAGKTAPEDVAAIEQSLPVNVPTVRRHTFIDDSDISTWFAACDVMVFPYERVLNSGSVLLSATFGRPCILPAEAHLVAEYGDQPWVTFYTPGADETTSLATAIVDALANGEATRRSAARFAVKNSTRNMAWEYVTIIEQLTAPTQNTRETS